MTARERLAYIKSYIESGRRVTVEELSINSEVTKETIRRDLDKLEQQGLITRVHGGAVWNSVTRSEEFSTDFYARQNTHAKEKRRIAMLASHLLEEKGIRTVMSDASSTAVEVLKAIQKNPDTIVMTNSSEIFSEVRDPKFSLISLGGAYNQRSQSFQGTLTKKSIYRYHTKLAFIGCKGLALKDGIMDSYENEAEIKKVMIQQSEEVAVLADYTKFNQLAFLKLADFVDIDYIITDRAPSSSWITFCEEQGIRLLY